MDVGRGPGSFIDHLAATPFPLDKPPLLFLQTAGSAEAFKKVDFEYVVTSMPTCGSQVMSPP
jgi:hypothetical protein